MIEAGPSIDRTVPNWYLGLTLSWAIFQGGLTRGQVREAKGTLATVAGQEAAQRLQVEVDVEQARLGVQAAKATITAAEEALVNARQQLTLAEGRYTHGLGSAVELGDAQVADTTAKAQAVQARFNLAVARAQRAHRQQPWLAQREIDHLRDVRIAQAQPRQLAARVPLCAQGVFVRLRLR